MGDRPEQVKKKRERGKKEEERGKAKMCENRGDQRG